MPYHEVKDPFQTAQDVLFEQLRKAGAEKQRREREAEQYQSMLINSTTYRYDSSDGEIYNSSASDLREGDRVLINSYWWSPKLVVIFR